MPDALHGDQVFGLPPYSPRNAYLVDEYPSCPKNWMRSKGITKSYFVPILEDKGMWLDFNQNISNNPNHHVAVLISVQGVNPITGLPCKDSSLEQYLEKCPKHKVEFGPDRFCPKCNYKWPKQNYLCSTTTPLGLFWLDGFRNIDGMVRQYILTEEKIKGVAKNIIGKNRVFAIGISFYISKKRIETPKHVSNIIYTTNNPLLYYKSLDDEDNYHYPHWNHYNSFISSYSMDVTNADFNDGADSLEVNTSCSLSNIISKQPKKGIVNTKKGIIDARNTDKEMLRLCKFATEVKTKQLEIGAGAKINQQVYDDSESLDYWKSKPEAMLYINYCLEKEAEKILQSKKDIKVNKEGFLQKIPVGN